MPSLTGQPPLGPKTGKLTYEERNRPRKPIPRISAKKRAHKAAEKALWDWDHMAWVKTHDCCACGAPGPSEAHHVTGKRSDLRVIALCQPCHTGPYGFHKAKKSWLAKHGPDAGFLHLYEKAPTQGT